MLIESMNFSQMIENFFNIPEGPDAFMIGFMCTVFMIVAIFVGWVFYACISAVINPESKEGPPEPVIVMAFIVVTFIGIPMMHAISASCQPDHLSIMPVADTYALNEDIVALQVTSYDKYIPTDKVNNCRVPCPTLPDCYDNWPVPFASALRPSLPCCPNR